MPDHESAYQILRGQIAHYKADDYLTMAPYERLKEFSGNHVMRYIQYLPILLEDAHCKDVNLELAQIFSDVAQVSIAPEWAANFLQHIVRESQNTPDDGLVHVLPLMCGAGKSSAISQMISQRILNHLKVTGVEPVRPDEEVVQQDYGLMVVTDSIQRAEEYLHPGKQRYNATALVEHPDLVTIMTRENLQDARVEMKHNPVLVMTTQRYFKLSTQELEPYLTWDYGRRNLIVFDEQPMLLQFVSVSNLTLANVMGVLAGMIPDKDEEQEDKDWCIEQWRNLEIRLGRQLRTLERRGWNTDNKYPNSYCYHCFTEDEQQFTDDDERFMAFVDRHKAYLSNAYWTIIAAEQMLREGAVYCSTKQRTRYESVFGVVLDHRSRIAEAGAKAIVFDGTGDIVPDYSDARFVIEHEMSEQLRRNLSNMAVTFIDMNTSKTNMAKDTAHRDLAGMVTYLQQIYGESNGAIFTYEAQEGNLRRIVENRGLAGRMLIQHFGNIKGGNAYRQLAHIAQIGLFARTPLEYLCQALALNPDRLNEFRALTPDDGNQWVRMNTVGQEWYDDVQTRIVLADTEQNLFRGTIRDARCTEQYNYYVFCKKEAHGRVFDAMRARYPEVHMRWIDAPLDIRLNKIRESRRDSVAKKFLTWYDALSMDTEFTMQEAQEALSIEHNQIKYARRDNPDLDELFKRIKVEGTLRYKKCVLDER